MADKGPNFSKEVIWSPSYGENNEDWNIKGICGFAINPKKTVLKFLNWQTLEICGCVIAEWAQELQRILRGTIKWPSKNENLEKPMRNSLWYRDENMKQKVQIPEKTYRDRTYGDVSPCYHGGGGRGVQCNLVALVTQSMWCDRVVIVNLDKEQST
jgi:hypothetical protein